MDGSKLAGTSVSAELKKHSNTQNLFNKNVNGYRYIVGSLLYLSAKTKPVLMTPASKL